MIGKLFRLIKGFVITVVGIVVICLAILGLASFKRFAPPAIKGNNEAGLRNVLSKQYALLNSEDGRKEICNSYIYSKTNGISECLKNIAESPGYQKVEVNSVRVEGEEAFVDRTLTVCKSESCQEVVTKSRQTKRYVWVNETWKMDADKFLCARDKPYPMNPAFDRALSLVIQRLKEMPSNYANTLVGDIANCLDIQYAPSEKDMGGAEGYFTFRPGQSSERLLIYVDPAYQAKDDIMTALLLSHEATHAYNYAMNDLLLQKPLDCYADESLAFQFQTVFLFSLNPGEKQSLIARYVTNGDDGELRGTLNLLMSFVTKGDVDHNKTLRYVKSSPYYQKQCAGR